jgi:hypothetical protein
VSHSFKLLKFWSFDWIQLSDLMSNRLDSFLIGIDFVITGTSYIVPFLIV